MITDTDLTYLNYCKELSLQSRCYSRKIGAIIVIEDVIVAHGVNGPLPGLLNCVDLYDMLNNIESNYLPHCPRKRIGCDSGEHMEYCQAMHAERAAIAMAARERRSVINGTLYMNSCIPCKDCMLAIISAGIARVVIDELVIYGNSFLSPYIAHHSGVIVEDRDGKLLTSPKPEHYRG